MGSASSKPVKSAASAVSRRQYPKNPSAPPPPPPSPAASQSTPRSSPAAASAPPSREPRDNTPQGPTYHSKEPPSSVRSNAIDLDGRDPDFAASLRKLGAVNPSPTFSNSSTFNRPPSDPSHPGQFQTVFPQSSNPALLAVTARQRISKAAEQEAENFGQPGASARGFVDALTVRQALAMRDRQGLPGGEIERMLGLKKGIVSKLGREGVVSAV